MSTPPRKIGTPTRRKRIDASNFLDFDWNKVKLFYHIAKYGSFVKAAKFLGIDQPSLSRQIQTLEKQVGYPLLVRRTGAKGGVVLTRRGEELLNEVTPFFLRMKGFCGNPHVDIGGEKKRKIRIATSHAVSAYIINDLIFDYNKENPHIIFEIIGDDGVIDVILNDVDIAIRPYNPESMGIEQEPLFTLQKKLYASDKYIQKYGEPKTVEDLKNHRLIAIGSKAEDYPYVSVHWILELGMPKGQKHEPIFLSNSIEGRVGAAKKGIGIISSYGMMSIVRDAHLKNILPDVYEKGLEEYFSYPSYLKKDQEIINLKEYLREKLSAIKE